MNFRYGLRLYVDTGVCVTMKIINLSAHNACVYFLSTKLYVTSFINLHTFWQCIINNALEHIALFIPNFTLSGQNLSHMYVERDAVVTRLFFQCTHILHPIAHRWWQATGCLVRLNPCLYSASGTAAAYAMSYCTGPSYNGILIRSPSHPHTNSCIFLSLSTYKSFQYNAILYAAQQWQCRRVTFNLFKDPSNTISIGTKGWLYECVGEKWSHS